jgi:probable rRNA maturation factor
MLHLAGHDHETDRGQMRGLEQSLRAELKLPAGLIERAEPVRAASSRRGARASTRVAGAGKNGRRAQ